MSSKLLEIYKVILSPLNTEKTNKMTDRYNRFSFKVATWANKMQIKQAVESIFKVNVLQVAVVNVRGKMKMFKQQQGKKSNWKKAVVKLESGQDINITDFIK
jgi:large subunit ribosomal protein L23